MKIDRELAQALLQSRILPNLDGVKRRCWVSRHPLFGRVLIHLLSELGEDQVEVTRHTIKVAVDVAEPIMQAATEAMAAITILTRRDQVAWRLCDPEAAEIELGRCSDRQPDRARVLTLLKDKPERVLPVARVEHIDALWRLREDFPNFTSVLEQMCTGLELRARVGDALRLPPILMLGPPGLGKTALCRRIASVLPVHFEDRSLADVTAGWILSGGSKSWSESAPGLIATMLATLPDDKAPLLLLDELDKAGGDARWSPDRALLGLLEPVSARVFRDENLSMVIDAEPLSCVLTANRRELIREELLSRLHVAQIAAPTRDQMPAVIRSIDNALRRERRIDSVFAPLDEVVIGALAQTTPRELRRVLEQAYALAAKQHRGTEGLLRLELHHMPLPDPAAPSKPKSIETVTPMLLLHDPSSRRH